METKYIVGILAAALLLGTYVAEFAVDSGSVAPANQYLGPEALKWLRGNESESALASNRFGETSQALRFVKQLYDAGAEKVIVLQDSIRSDEYETYADALVVTLPEDAERRARVLELCAPELAREGISVGDLDGEKQVLLWWD
jgi:hypothetical protein